MIVNNIHSKYLQSVNNLSQRNLGLTGKNPSVACMIVDYSKSSEGQVLSYGLTSIGGSPHAEVNALNKISNGNLIGLHAIGGGLSWGASIIRIGKPKNL